MINPSWIQITRPPSVGYEDPFPLAISNTLTLRCRALFADDKPADLTGVKIYVTIKADLADEDNKAKLLKDSTNNPEYFTLEAPKLGLYRVTIPAGDLAAALEANTDYHIDTTLVLATGEVFIHVFDIIRPFQQVTRSIS